MVGNILAGDQAGELGQHPGQSRSGDRHHGCRGVGGGGCERHAAHLRWLPRRRCPGDSANRRDLLEPSCGRPGLGVKLAQAVEIALALALAVAFDVAFARVIPVGEALMRTGLTWAAS